MMDQTLISKCYALPTMVSAAASTTVSVVAASILFLLFHVSTAETVDLPLSDINVVVLTDVHSWVAGHGRHEPHFNADYGDVLSFYKRLEFYTSSIEKDLFFVNNGDFMDGTGLSTNPPDRLIPIIERMPFDAFNLGNHELYHKETVDFIIHSGFINHWWGSYLSSNVYMSNSGMPFGDLFTYLYGSFSQTKVLTFGFLYNFANSCESTRVQPVQEAVNEKWFIDVLQKGDFDAVLVLAHMDYQDPLVTVIRHAIRNIVDPDMPIQFINGHTHVRGFAVQDNTSTSFEAGAFLDTVGFVSFPRLETAKNATNATSLFEYRYLDANKEVLRQTLDVDILTEPEGRALSVYIQAVRQPLTELIGCSRATYYLDKGMDQEDSLWGLFMKQIVPSKLLRNGKSQIYVQTTGALRYNLFRGNVTLDDLIAVSPFNDTIYRVATRVRGSKLSAALELMKKSSFGFDASELPPVAMSTDEIDPDRRYDVFSADWDANALAAALKNVSGKTFHPVQLSDKDGNPATTTQQLWIDFVRDEWHCKRAPLSISTEWAAAIAIVLVVVVCTLWFLSQRLQGKSADNYLNGKDVKALLSDINDFMDDKASASKYGSIDEQLT